MNRIDFDTLVKERGKTYGLRFRKDNWTINNNSIFEIFQFMKQSKDGEMLEYIRCYFKPLWADDLFWDIWDIGDVWDFDKFKDLPNAKRNILRINGVTMAPKKIIYEKLIDVENTNIDAEKDFYNYIIDNILNLINKTTDVSYEFEKTDYRYKEGKALIEIHNGNYKKAKSILKTIFRKTDGIDACLFKKYAQKYIRRKMFRNLK